MNPKPLKYIEKENTDVNFYVYVDIWGNNYDQLRDVVKW